MLIEASFSEEEIKATIFGLWEDKALWPDGFPIAFFLQFWDLLKGELLQFFIEFYENGQIVGELGASFIVLIPKKEGAISIRDFRPISLIGSIYKILANRLRKVLLYVISENRSALVDGRLVLDCVITAFEDMWLTRSGAE